MYFHFFFGRDFSKFIKCYLSGFPFCCNMMKLSLTKQAYLYAIQVTNLSEFNLIHIMVFHALSHV